MQKQLFRSLLTACLLLLLCSTAFGGQSAKEGILLVAFGTSVESALVSYKNVEEQVKKAFPDHPILWAWTAHSLLKKNPSQNSVLSPQEALAKFATEGIKKVSVLSLHVIPGQEYFNLIATAAAFQGLPKGLEQVNLTVPLLYDTGSVATMAEVLLRNIPKARKPGEAVLLVGHGTHHPGGVYYPALQYYVSEKDPNVFIGTIEGDLDIKSLLKKIKAKGIKTVWMAPLMVVAGDHATNDLFGDEPDSWKQLFAAQGIKVQPIAKGLGEYPDIVNLWVEGLKNLGKENAH